MRYGRMQRRRFKRRRYGYRKRYPAYRRNPYVVNRKASQANYSGRPELTTAVSLKRWVNWVSATAVDAPFTQISTSGYYSIEGYKRVNNLYDPTSATGNPYSVGFSTYRRLYEYYRPYKFKNVFKFFFSTSGTARETDYYYLCAFPTLGSTSPWTDLFGGLRDMRYALQTARANRFLVVKRISASTMKTRNVITLKCPTVTLKDLAGMNPAITIGSTGIPSDTYTAATTAAPTATVYWWYMIVTATAYVPNFAVEVTASFAAKTLFFQRSPVTIAVTADEQV